MYGERPVQRDRYSGQLVIHPAYEGWAPSPPRKVRRVLVALLIGLALSAMLHFIGT